MYIITGGGSGIGKALAWRLADQNRSVLIVGRHEAPLLDASAHSSHISYICADVSKAEGREAVLQKVQGADLIDGLINNAGTIEPITSIHNVGAHDWRQLMATNVEAPLFLSQLLYNHLKGGRVLNIGSGAAYFPVAGWSAYCVSKAALAMMTQCWQLESHDVAFANVMPGIIDTNMQAVIRKADNMASDKQVFFQQLKERGQLLSPETVALFLSWLLLNIDDETYQSKEWDIYDKTHHEHWLVPPHKVPEVG